MKNRGTLLVIFLGVILAGLLVYIIATTSVDKHPDDDFTGMLSNYLHDFLSKVSVGNYEGAYKQLAEKSKNELFHNSADLAVYCTRNFLTNAGSVRYTEILKYEEISENEYLINVIVGNENGDFIDDDLTAEEAELENIIAYQFVIKFIDGYNNYTIEII